MMLQVRELEVAYGRVRAVQGVSFEVHEGEIVALIGPNGAGKSSSMHAISGVVPAAGGQVRFKGQEITNVASHRIVAAGLVQVPEGRMIFTGLTIRENLALGAHSVGDANAALDRVLPLFPMLADRLDENAHNLSGGQLQMLALARGLMATPALLMMDEPSLGLSPIASREIFRMTRNLQAQGVTILLVEQNVRQALAIADRGYVIEGGRLILSGAAADLLADEFLVASYLGVKREG
jgi:branched-chain amino acid transport system ATP-binding protein